jgi:hypothetical protein
MSFAIEDEADCPCGETFATRVWSSVNLKEDEELRSALLGGALNVVPCSLCKAMVYVDRFLLIHDPDTELLAFIHPKAREADREELQISMLRDTAEAQGVEGGLKVPYAPLLFFGLESVVDLLKKEEEIADQSAILEALAPELSLKLVKLSPSQARPAGLPWRIPVASGAAAVEGLIGGLKTLLAANDRLTIYADLLRRAEAGELPLKSISA